MNFQQTLQYLYSALPMYQRIGKAAYKKDLANTLRLCDHLGNPHRRLKAVHVAGTNGKGSSAHMLSAILQSAGYKTGLYTSPHLKSFTERIRVDGKEMSEEAVISFVAQHQGIIEEIKPSFFEITVVMAFDYFVRQEVDIAVIEVGLGGRLDSTNVITPEVSLITNISLDHQEMLGQTMSEIAVEKAGIIKNSVPVVIGNRQDETVGVFLQISDDRGSPIIFAEDKIGENSQYELDLKGDYQQNNLPGVLSTVNELINEGWQVTDLDIRNGLSNTIALTGLKGRWQTLGVEPLMICDTGHNEDGVRSILDQLLRIPKNDLHIIWGMVDDKDSKSILEMLPKVASYTFCQAHVPRAKDAELLYLEAKASGLVGKVIRDVNEAIADAIQIAEADDVIFIGGSTFVVAEIDNL